MAKGLRVRWCSVCGEPIVVKEKAWPVYFSQTGEQISECPHCYVYIRQDNLLDAPPAHVQARRVCRFCLARYENGRRLQGRDCVICRAAPEKALVPYADLARIILRNLERMEIA